MNFLFSIRLFCLLYIISSKKKPPTTTTTTTNSGNIHQPNWNTSHLSLCRSNQSFQKICMYCILLIFHQCAVCHHSLLILSLTVSGVKFLISAKPKQICYDTPVGQKLRLLLDTSSGRQFKVFKRIICHIQLYRVQRVVKCRVVNTWAVQVKQESIWIQGQ